MKEMRKEEDGIFLQTKHTVRLASKNFLEIKNTVFVQRAGLPIFKVLPDGKRKVLPGLEKVFGI